MAEISNDQNRTSAVSNKISQYDPCQVGMMIAAMAGTTTGTSTGFISILPATTVKSKAPATTQPSCNTAAPAVNYMEVEPLICQLVPEGVADAINNNLELSKSSFLGGGGGGMTADEVAAPVPYSNGSSNGAVAPDDDAAPDWKTLPKNLSGKVAFFEQILLQKKMDNTPAVLDPTIKVKAEVSEKVKSVHTQVQTSLNATKVSTNGGTSVVLPDDITPLAVKKERVQTFFPQDETTAAASPAAKSAAAGAGAASPSKWDKVETTLPSTFENPIKEENGNKEEEEHGESKEAEPSELLSPAPKVDDMVTAMEKSLDDELTSLKNEFSNFDEKALDLSSKFNASAEPTTGGSFDLISMTPSTEQPSMELEPMLDSSNISNGHATPKSNGKDTTSVEEASPVEVEKEEDPVADKEVSVEEKKEQSESPAEAEVEAEVDPAVLTGDLAVTETVMTVDSNNQSADVEIDPAVQACDLAATEALKTVDNSEQSAQSEAAAEVDPAILAGDLAATEALETLDNNEQSVQPEAKAEVDPAILAGDLAATKALKTVDNTPLVDPKPEAAEATGVSTEESHGESLSRDVAAEVLQADDEPIQASSSAEEFPALGTNAPRSASQHPSEKSYARALAEGEKQEKAKGFSLRMYLEPPYAPVPSLTQDETSTSAGLETTEEDVTAVGDKQKMSEIAQKLAEGSTQKKGTTAVKESKEEASDDSGFTPILREPKRKQQSEEDEPEEKSLPAAVNIEMVAPETAPSTLVKANFNPYDILVDGTVDDTIAAPSVASPIKNGTAKKSKGVKNKKAKAQPAQSKKVRFGAKNTRKLKAASRATEVDEFGGFEVTHSWTPWFAVPLHLFNNLVHVRPISYVFDAVFWCLFLLVAGPVAAVGLILLTAFRIVKWFVRLFGIGIIAPKKTPEKQLAVVVTGCDTGFGRDLSMQLMREGFVVFCGCLRKESLKDFKDEKLAMPLLMDVTKDSDVDKAAKAVSDWLAKDDKRYFHALVNNGGVGSPGLIDWAPLADFEKMSEVNYIGMIRCCKKFLPLFKSQGAEGVYKDARIVNMVSMAGIVSGGMVSVGYEASKHAAEAFTTNLRLETKSLGLKVTAISPSFHKTPITASMSENLGKLWKTLSPEKKQIYGDGTYSFFNFDVFHCSNTTNLVPHSFLSLFSIYSADYVDDACAFTNLAQNWINWDSVNVVHAMQRSLTDKNPPPRILVGSDARYTLIVMKMLPTWLTSRMMDLKTPEVAMMAKKKK